MPEENMKKILPENSQIRKKEPSVGACKQVFETQQEMDKFFCDFRESVAPDLRLLAVARRKWELMVRRGQI